MRSKGILVGLSVSLLCLLSSRVLAKGNPKPRVIVIGVNGMEWDIIRPLLLRGELPSLAKLIEKGVYGKLQTLSAPNCPKVYTTIATSTPPEQNGITGFVVRGITANTSMLREEPIWSILSKSGATVGMAKDRKSVV